MNTLCVSAINNNWYKVTLTSTVTFHIMRIAIEAVNTNIDLV